MPNLDHSKRYSCAFSRSKPQLINKSSDYFLENPISTNL